uniref:Protein transport protein Sec24-like CEF n=1 Tax=Caenorhabditis tropicalis TaxID=1561998 RepID=A0A1I7UM59_9PELO
MNVDGVLNPSESRKFIVEHGSLATVNREVPTPLNPQVPGLHSSNALQGPGVPGSHSTRPGITNFPGVPGAFPLGPQAPGPFQPGPGRPRAYTQGTGALGMPGCFPMVSQVPGSLPSGQGVPKYFPLAPGAPGLSGTPEGHPTAPQVSESFPPGSQIPGSFTPGQRVPGSFSVLPPPKYFGKPERHPTAQQVSESFPPGSQIPGSFRPGQRVSKSFTVLPPPKYFGKPEGFPTAQQVSESLPPGSQIPGSFTPGQRVSKSFTVLPPLKFFGKPEGHPTAPQVPGPFPPGTYPQGPGAPGIPQGYPGGPPQQRQHRLDPNIMPNAVQVIEDDDARAGIFPTGYRYAELPPLVSTFSFAQDQGNCNPKFMRSTLYTVPQTNDMLKASRIPLAVVISPFAALNEYEKEPPVVDLGSRGPIRCQRCKAYICPFMEFQDGGRSFRCPFCHANTPVEEDYFAHLDHTGKRTDIEMRPEPSLGAYDLVATKEYCKNGLTSKEPAFLFMIDVSYNALSNGMLPILCQNLEKVLRNLPRETGQLESSIRVGLATFDQSVHFLDISSTPPKMFTMSNVQEPFVPIVNGLLLPYNEALPGLRSALALIPKIFSQTKTKETILQPVVQAGLDALKCADRAGKLLVFTTVLPTYEAPGKLKTKNDRSFLGTDKEKNAFVPQEESYAKLGERCVKFGVTVDLFLFPNSFIDVATIGQLSAVTGGSIFKFQYFSAEKDGIRMLNELEKHVSKK